MGRTSTLLKAPKAVGCTCSGDHVVRVVALRGVVSTMGFELVALGLTYAVLISNKYRTPWPTVVKEKCGWDVFY